MSTPFPGGHQYKDEPRISDEPFGYEVGDDPFETQGQSDYPAVIILFAILSFVHFIHSHFKMDNLKVGEILYHQRYTANQLEDEIKRLRALKKQ